METADEAVKTTAKPNLAGDDQLASFDEWKQKILMEAENDTENANSAVIKNLVVDGGAVAVPKKQPLNFASVDCGARIVAHSHESTNVHAILTGSTDEYMNNPCSAQRKYFVVELCDSVSISEIEIGNLELFSSLPKYYNISISDRFPTKEWFHLGKFQAKEERKLSMFKISDFIASNGGVKQVVYAKFVKVEMIDHYGTEHYCPLTVVRVFGVGLLEDDNDDDDDGSNEVFEEHPTLLDKAKTGILKIIGQVIPPRPAPNQTNSSNKSHWYSNNMSQCDSNGGLLPTLFHCICCDKDSISYSQTKYQQSELCSYFDLTMNQMDEVSPIGSYIETRPKEQDKKTVESNVDKISTNKTQKSSCPSKREEKPVVKVESEQKPPKQQSSNSPKQNAKPEEVSISNNSTEVDEEKKTEKKDDNTMEDTQAKGKKAEEVIVESLMETVSSVAADEEEELSTGSKGEAKVRPAGHLGGHGINKLRTPSPSTQTSKQLLVRFVGRVRELELNLSLTNRYLEELSLNYRRRLDDMKLRVDGLHNLTQLQAAEIERLTKLVNMTAGILDPQLLSSEAFAALTIPVIILSIIVWILISVCSCITRKLTGQNVSRENFPHRFETSRIPNGPSHRRSLPLDSSYSPVRSNSFRVARNNESHHLHNAKVAASSGSSLAPSTPTRRDSSVSSSSHSNFSNGFIDSGHNTCDTNHEVLPVTPLVIPCSFSDDFFVSPENFKGKNGKKLHQNQQKTKNHNQHKKKPHHTNNNNNNNNKPQLTVHGGGSGSNNGKYAPLKVLSNHHRSSSDK